MDNNTISPCLRLKKSKDASAYLAISERKLFSMTKAGDIPVVRMGRSVRYDLRDLEDFIQKAKG